MNALDRYRDRLEDLGDSWLEDAKDTVYVQSTSEKMTLHVEQRVSDSSAVKPHC